MGGDIIMRIKRDADNKWYFAINWNPWIDEQALTPPNGPGMTVTITGVSWGASDPAGLVEEGETPSDDDAGLTYYFGSGGTNGVKYSLTGTITFTATSASGSTTKTDLTQDETVEIELENQ